MPPVKIFIDSRFRRDGSFSAFSFQLPRPFDVQKQYRAMVDQVHIPHTFPTITANNRSLYLEETYDDLQNPGQTITRQRKVLLDVNNYDGAALATEAAAKMNAGTFMSGTPYAATFSDDQGKLTFTVTGGTAFIYPMDYLLANPASFTDFYGSPVVEHDDAGEVLGLTGTFKLPLTTVSPLVGRHISALPFHVLYLHCDQGLGTGEDAIGPRGNGTILRSIPVTSAYGQMLHDLSLNPHDHTLIHKGQMQTFKFRLADRHGRDVPLDQPFSFSILLSPVDELE